MAILFQRYRRQCSEPTAALVKAEAPTPKPRYDHCFGPSTAGGSSAMGVRERDEDNREEARRTAALIGLIVILMLAIAGVVVVRELRRTTGIEDCLMAGRHNCTPIEAPPPDRVHS